MIGVSSRENVGEVVMTVSMDSLWNYVENGSIGIECNHINMSEMLRCLKGDTRKGSLWLPLKEIE